MWHFNELVYSTNQNKDNKIKNISSTHNKDKKDYFKKEMESYL